MPHVISEKAGVLRVKVTGVITVTELHQMLDELDAILKDRTRWANNLMDLRGVDLSGLGFVDMMSLAKRRMAVQPPNPIRTAFIADSPTVIGFVRMFQSLNHNPSISSELFDDVAAAEKWLAAAGTQFI